MYFSNVFGLSFSFKLTIVTTLVSNIFLGMGTWTFFQILAWIVICLLTQCLIDLYQIFNRKPHIIVMAIFAFFMGYVFGFVVSLDKLMIGGPSLFIVYYSFGILFDTFHAVGNLFFYLLAAPILIRVLNKYIKIKQLKMSYLLAHF